MKRLAALTLALAGAACSTSPIEGPQFTRLPAGVGYQASVPQGRTTLVGLELLRSRTWNRSTRPSLGLGLAEYRGELAARDVAAARRAVLNVAEGSSKDLQLPELDSLVVDGRPAWGWTTGEGAWTGYSAFVTYPDATFYLAVSGDDPSLQAPGAPRALLLGFRREPDRPADVLVPVLVLAAVAVAAALWWRRRSDTPGDDRPDRPAREF